MTLKVIEGDLLDITDGAICHQVNTRGVMGAGIAKLIAEKWPVVFRDYKALCDAGLNTLGWHQKVPITDTLSVINIFGQADTGGKRATNYGAVADAFLMLKGSIRLNEQVYVPYEMGCGLGGGDWSVYSEIIEYCIPDAIVVKLPEVWEPFFQEGEN